ncbi:unnamed protein product [Porites lobata]|uniref:Vps16 N-terminal domain-containing protein n=1 Tax=Porites lobata TaxID=104759 RepID=A0ABN8P558_9CNID|nr:unnamed protein product [Porites lobata]
MAHVTVDWNPLGKVFYRKVELYSMEWQDAVDLSRFIVSAAPFGGPIGNYRESSRESSLTGQKTKDSPMTDFSNFTILQYGYIPTSDCMRETRPIQIIKRMFLQGHLYQASFSQLKFQIPAPNANKQHVYFVTSNDSGLNRPLGLIKISCNIHVTAATRDEKLRKWFVLYATKNCFQSSWRFLKFSGMYIQIETFMYAITSHKNSNSGQEVKLQAELITSKVSSKKTP